MYRDHNCNELNIKNVNEEVQLAGWVQRIRNLGSMQFVDLRDEFGITQIVISNDEVKKEMEKVTPETVISVTGKVVERSNKNKNIPTGEIEIDAKEIQILGKCKNQLPFEINSEKIDIENPKIEKVNPVKPWTMNYTQQINIILTDAHSGVGGYCIKRNTTKPDKNDSCFKTVNFPAYGGTGTVTVLLPKGKYYIFVKDRVGNVSNYDPNNKNLTFEVKDEIKPNCTVTSPNNTVNGWFNKNFTVKVNTSDDSSGVRAWDLTLSPNPTYNNVTSLTHTKDTSGTTYYGYVEDRAGNKNKCYGTFKKDTAGPIFQGGGEVSTGSVNPVIFHDSLSGMNRVEYIFSNSSDTPSPNDAWSGTTTGTTDCGNTIYVFAKGTDNAENYTIVPLGSYNTGSCVPRNSCNIRGDTIISTYSWTCSRGHRHTTAYRRFCSYSDGNIYPATSVSSGGPGKYVCPTRPFTEADGWYIIGG